MSVPTIAGMNIGSAFTAALAGVFAVLVLAGQDVPFISGDRQAFIALAVIGFLQCSIGMTASAVGGKMDWLNWANIAGTVLGIAAIALVAAVLTGRSAPLIPGYREAFVILTLLMLAKWSLHRIYFLLAPA